MPRCGAIFLEVALGFEGFNYAGPGTLIKNYTTHMRELMRPYVRWTLPKGSSIGSSRGERGCDQEGTAAKAGALVVCCDGS